MSREFTFDYQVGEAYIIELNVTDDMIDEAAAEQFREYATQNDGSFDIHGAIECACGAFWKEGELNAIDCLVGEGNFWKYIKENTSFFDSDAVQIRAREKAVQDFEARNPKNEM